MSKPQKAMDFYDFRRDLKGDFFEPRNGERVFVCVNPNPMMPWLKEPTYLEVGMVVRDGEGDVVIQTTEWGERRNDWAGQ